MQALNQALRSMLPHLAAWERDSLMYPPAGMAPGPPADSIL
jgi:hypothetical protein